MAPITNTSSHQPCAKKQAMTHATLTLMAMLYLTTRLCWSSCGDSGSDVIDCLWFTIPALLCLFREVPDAAA